jgi:hypothetical protein
VGTSPSHDAALLNVEELRVLRRDDADVVERDRLLFLLTIDAGRVAGKDGPHETADRLRLFGRAIPISAVRDEKKVLARSADRPRSNPPLMKGDPRSE